MFAAHQQERMLAMQAAKQSRQRGSSQLDFETAVESQLLSHAQNNACAALVERGELEHLVAWVWTFRRWV